MTQEQLIIIAKVIRSGAPALADELLTAIGNIIAENAEYRKAAEGDKSKEEESKK